MDQKTMKALYMTEPNPESFKMCDRPIPTPKQGEVLIKVGACGICHTDIIIRSGTATHTVYPFVPDHEYAGTIVEVGPGVENLKVGDRGAAVAIIPDRTTRNFRLGRSLGVCNHREMGSNLDGGMAEYCVMPANHFMPIPDTMSLSEGAFVEPLANACFAIDCGKILPSDTVVVIGPGPIGIAACKLATFYGASKVILVGTRDSRLAVATENDFGVDEVVNIRKPGAEEYLMNELLGGKGADVVLEASGSLSGFELAMRIIAPAGRILCEGTPPTGETVPFSPILLNATATICRVAGWRDLDFYNALQLIASGRINVKPLITHELPLSEWEKGFDMAVNNKDEAMKIMLVND